MQRRDFIGTLAGAAVAVSLPTRLLGAEKVCRIGNLGGAPGFPLQKEIVHRLEELGYSEGKNLTIDWRYDNGRKELAPELAAELVSLKPDVILASGSENGLAAQKATATIPIVVGFSHDGTGSGLYKSLSHPGGNITGIDTLSPEIDVKRVEMLKEILPKLSRLTVLHNPTFPGARLHSETILAAAQKLNVAVYFVEVRAYSDFDAAFEVILNDRPDAVLTVADTLIFYPTGRKLITDFEKAHDIPMIHEVKSFVELGGLISYGPDFFAISRRLAEYVDKIFKGEKPGDIPVELPTKFDLTINLKTAKALGITFPNNLIVSANVVVE